MAKLCPILAVCGVTSGNGNLSDCQEEKCAWWFADKCAIVSLAEATWTVQDKLDDIHRLELNKM